MVIARGDDPYFAYSIEDMEAIFFFPTKALPGIEVGLEYPGGGDDGRLDGRTLVDWDGSLFLVNTMDLEWV